MGFYPSDLRMDSTSLLLSTRQVQETGVAPTDDGFTILERSEEHEQFEDGPTLTGCSENKAFRAP